MIALKKKESWIKPRHKIVRNIANAILRPYTRIKYGLKPEKFKGQTDRAYLILYNHQTVFDQFFVGMSFPGVVYYLATEDIFSNGWVSSLIRFLVNPIPINKQSTDIKAIKTCIQVAGEGATIAIAPEGNRTYSGKTEYINPSIAYLAKKLGLPVALYRIEGGYGVQPRWSDVLRRGKMRSYVARVIEPEEYRAMSNEELLAAITEGLQVNEAAVNGEFIHKKRAEYLERLLYVCPFCGLSEFESHKSEVACKKCGRRVIYETTKELTGVGFELPFRFVNDWYEYQNEYVSSLDTLKNTETALYRDQASLWQVIPRKNKTRLSKSASFALYGDRVAVDQENGQILTLSFDEIYAAAVLGRNKLNLYHRSGLYQVKGDKRFNAIKYVNLYFRYKNIKDGKEDGKFLGL